MPDIAITKEWQCPACDGTGQYANRKAGRVPCAFCNATGDQREMPAAWKTCPPRNRDAYHETLR